MPGWAQRRRRRHSAAPRLCDADVNIPLLPLPSAVCACAGIYTKAVQVNNGAKEKTLPDRPRPAHKPGPDKAKTKERTKQESEGRGGLFSLRFD